MDSDQNGTKPERGFREKFDPGGHHCRGGRIRWRA